MSLATLSGVGGGKDLTLFRKLVNRSITEVTAEDLTGLTTIGIFAFYACKSLTSVIIGNRVTRIEASAFQSCQQLTKIIIKAQNAPTLANVNAFTNTNNCPIYVPFYTTTLTNWVSISSRLFPLVNTVADLANIDTTAYTKACVIGVDETYKEYAYDGSQWSEVV